MPQVIVNKREVKMNNERCNFCSTHTFCVIGPEIKAFIAWAYDNKSWLTERRSIHYKWKPAICISCLEDFLPLAKKELKDVEAEVKRRQRGLDIPQSHGNFF